MILRKTSIGATTQNDNILAGSAFEFARARGVMSGGIGCAATGLIANVTCGADVVAEAFDVPILASGQDYPILPDNMYFTDVVEFMDRITIPVRNTTGGALVSKLVIQLSTGG
jgi:hypothetical protein